MRPRDDEPRRIIHIGPDADPLNPPPDDEPAPSFLISDERGRVEQADRQTRERGQLARRLLVAFVVIVLMAVGFHLILPAFGLRLPALVPVLSYAAIAAAAILTARDTLA